MCSPRPTHISPHTHFLFSSRVFLSSLVLLCFNHTHISLSVFSFQTYTRVVLFLSVCQHPLLFSVVPLSLVSSSGSFLHLPLSNPVFATSSLFFVLNHINSLRILLSSEFFSCVIFCHLLSQHFLLLSLFLLCIYLPVFLYLHLLSFFILLLSQICHLLLPSS